jgi:hypothetical protein
MKRIWVMVATASTLFVVGCGVPSYNKRIDDTVRNLKLEQEINTFLLPQTEGKVKELNVFLRLPKPAAELNPPSFAPPAGIFDFVASYQAQPEGLPAKDVATPAPPPPPPIKIHVFLRQKPKKAAAKKGEPAPAAPADRGNFITAVRQTIASEFGPEAANEKSPQPGNPFKTLKFAAQNGDDVRAYFTEANKGEIEAALVFDIPKETRDHNIVKKGVENTIRSFSLGGKKAPLQGSGKATSPDGPAF